MSDRIDTRMGWYFIFFFISGFCSVLYELVWLRLSMAQFGVTTAMVSIVLSVFMAGLGLGSWISGRWLRHMDRAAKMRALRLYALIELLIGVSGIIVPYGLLAGRRVLDNASLSSSFSYYLAAGSWVAAILLPWCCLIGATLPVGMFAIRQTSPAYAKRSFSYLYMANVAGAVAGTAIPLILIELLGFRGTLRVGVACNLLIAVTALARTRRIVTTASEAKPATSQLKSVSKSSNILILLFLSGLTCMAMEVVWVRRYTPFIGTVVYAFSSILAVYLVSTFLGSLVYRRWSSRVSKENPAIWMVLAACALLPLIAASPTVHMSHFLRLTVGIAPFTGLLGFITPMLVDRFSSGDSEKAGTAYAVNVAGCIVGPLIAGFGILPVLSERWAIVIFAAPWFVIGFNALRAGLGKHRVASLAAVCGSLLMAAALTITGKDFEDKYPDGKILRDSTATVIATGSGMDKELLVNGYGMTSLLTVTKLMAHLPLAFLDRPPQNAIVVCFGMGTTFRSLRSWGIAVTAAELVPSVPQLISYYHEDGSAVLASPLSHVVIDDGRRYLERTSEQFDVITIDPPPPLNAAASSLLYSEEFYSAARRRLRPGGILQQWLPTTPEEKPVSTAAVTRALSDSFPYVRAFGDEFGIHYLCSDRPIAKRGAEELLRRMPVSAVADLAEWEDPDNPVTSARDQLEAVLNQEVSVPQLITVSPNTPAVTDDRPITEYYVLRRWRAERRATGKGSYE